MVIMTVAIVIIASTETIIVAIATMVITVVTVTMATRVVDRCSKNLLLSFTFRFISHCREDIDELLLREIVEVQVQSLLY